MRTTNNHQPTIVDTSHMTMISYDCIYIYIYYDTLIDTSTFLHLHLTIFPSESLKGVELHPKKNPSGNRHAPRQPARSAAPPRRVRNAADDVTSRYRHHLAFPTRLDRPKAGQDDVTWVGWLEMAVLFLWSRKNYRGLVWGGKITRKHRYMKILDFGCSCI